MFGVGRSAFSDPDACPLTSVLRPLLKIMSRSAPLVLRRYKATLNRMETSIFTRLRHSFVTQRQSGSDRPTIPKPKADSLLPLRAESSASSDQSLPIVHRPGSFARRLASPSALQKREPPCPTAFPAGTISYSN